MVISRASRGLWPQAPQCLKPPLGMSYSMLKLHNLVETLTLVEPEGGRWGYSPPARKKLRWRSGMNQFFLPRRNESVLFLSLLLEKFLLNASQDIFLNYLGKKLDSLCKFVPSHAATVLCSKTVQT